MSSMANVAEARAALESLLALPTASKEAKYFAGLALSHLPEAQVGEHEIMVLKTEKAAWAAECARLQEREAATIERCAQVAGSFSTSVRNGYETSIAIAAAIRKLKDTALDPNIIHPGSPDAPGPFPEEDP